MTERNARIEDGRYWGKRERGAELMREWTVEDTIAELNALIAAGDERVGDQRRGVEWGGKRTA